MAGRGGGGAGILSTTPAIAWKAHYLEGDLLAFRCNDNTLGPYSGNRVGCDIVAPELCKDHDGLANPGEGVVLIGLQADPKSGVEEKCPPAAARARRVKCEYREHKDERGRPSYRDNSGRPVLSADGEIAAPAGTGDSARPPKRGRGGEAVCDERCPGTAP